MGSGVLAGSLSVPGMSDGEGPRGQGLSQPWGWGWGGRERGDLRPRAGKGQNPILGAHARC